MTTIACDFCGKLNESINYCDWDCNVAATKRDGGVVHTPNGLPIKCIKHDNSMWEHGNADHPDYKFPVDVVFVGTDDSVFNFVDADGIEKPPPPGWLEGLKHESHALVYTDGRIALTIYEENYCIWSVASGEYRGGRYSSKDWALSEESRKEIKLFLEGSQE